MSNDLLKAMAAGTTDTSDFAGSNSETGIHIGASSKGGLLNPEQSARFLDYMFDATVIGKVARTVRMKADTTEIDRIGVGEKLMKLASEAETTGANSAVTFSKISLTTKKLRLDWEIST
jgi:HK97 family phage major capsid protein